jgi:hypothetical protein
LEDNCDIGINLTFGISENVVLSILTAVVMSIFLSPVIENNYDDNDDEKNDIDPHHLTHIVCVTTILNFKI